MKREVLPRVGHEPEPIPAGPVSKTLARFAARRGLTIPPHQQPKEQVERLHKHHIKVELTDEAFEALNYMHELFRKRGLLVSKNDIIRSGLINSAERMREREQAGTLWQDL